MRLEVQMEGTPYNIAVAIETFSNNLLIQDRDYRPKYTVRSNLRDKEQNPIEVMLLPNEAERALLGYPKTIGWLTIQALPNRQSLLKINLPPLHVNLLLPVWEYLRTELERQGWIKHELFAEGNSIEVLPLKESRDQLATIDGQIIAMLTENPHISTAKIAQKIGLSEDRTGRLRAKLARAKLIPSGKRGRKRN